MKFRDLLNGRGHSALGRVFHKVIISSALGLDLHRHYHYDDKVPQNDCLILHKNYGVFRLTKSILKRTSSACNRFKPWNRIVDKGGSQYP